MIQPAFHIEDDGTTLTVVYRCLEDGFETDRETIASIDVPDMLRDHLVDEHPGSIPFGRCAECTVITDDFRAVAPGVGEQWLCAQHAPSLPTVVDQAGAGDDGPVFT